MMMAKQMFLLLIPIMLLLKVFDAQHITSSFVSTHTFGDLSRMQIIKNNHWIFHEQDIQYDLDITVTEAYHGCVKEVSYQRLIPDYSCEIVNCAYCKSKGIINTKTVSKKRSFEQHLQSPCPVCLGRLKAGKDGCKYYQDKVENVQFIIPSGARLGYQVKFSQLGNAMLDHSTAGNFTFTTGDLILTVGAVTDPTKSGLNMTMDGLEIDIIMKPIEALEGFTRKYNYFDGKVINIDKTNKTTLPGSEIIMDDNNLVNPAGGRQGLLIRFSLLTVDQLKAKLAEELKMQANEEAAGQIQSTVISSQDDFDEWVEKKKDKRKQFKRDSIITKFLFDIKRRQDEGKLNGDYGDDNDDENDNDDDESSEQDDKQDS